MDIASISAIVAAVGVIVGVALAYLEIRNLVKTRQTDLVVRLHSTYGSREFQEAHMKVIAREFEDYNDYEKKYGWSEITEVGIFFEGIGVLLHRKLIDIGLVADLISSPIKLTWEKMKPIAEGMRKQYNRPQIGMWFEYSTIRCRRENKHYNHNNNSFSPLFFPIKLLTEVIKLKRYK